MVRFNQRHPVLNLEIYPAHSLARKRVNDGIPGLPYDHLQERITCHGLKFRRPDWGYHSHSIALTLSGGDQDDDIHMIFNAYWEDLSFELPPYPKGDRWLRFVDTGRPSPQDILDEGNEQPINGYTYLVGARSVVILVARDAQNP
jgi:glycogen operon protein